MRLVNRGSGGDGVHTFFAVSIYLHRLAPRKCRTIPQLPNTPSHPRTYPAEIMSHDHAHFIKQESPDSKSSIRILSPTEHGSLLPHFPPAGPSLGSQSHPIPIDEDDDDSTTANSHSRSDAAARDEQTAIHARMKKNSHSIRALKRREKQVQPPPNRDACTGSQKQIQAEITVLLSAESELCEAREMLERRNKVLRRVRDGVVLPGGSGADVPGRRRRYRRVGGRSR